MTVSVQFRSGNGLLTAADTGSLNGVEPVLLPIMAPRLQADLEPDGRLVLSLWGCGTLATVLFAALAAPYAYRPNGVLAANGGVFVAQSHPAMLIVGTRLRRLTPAKRAAWWHSPGPNAAPTKVQKAPTQRTVTLDWGVVIVEQRGSDLVVACGEDIEEASAAIALSIDVIKAEAEAYCLRCDRLADADPLLRSMVQQGTHAALSSIRQDKAGNFAGLAAGQAYSAPARTYYRDGYWTLQPLLVLAPEAVRGQIRLLAMGVQANGEAPSAVILSGPAQSAAWDVFRTSTHPYVLEHVRAGDWWSDHFDSPLFFVLTLADYVRTTGDLAEAKAQWPLVQAIVARYAALGGSDGLPKKPNHDRDWADNVYREGYVSYNIGLWVGVLDAVAELGGRIDPQLAAQAADLAATARRHIDKRLWVAERGSYADFRNSDGYVEDHVMLDTLTLLRYDAVSPQRAAAALETARTTLESRNNADQPYGDWGVLCAYPPYRRPRDVRAKSAFAFRYHNGSDWPYLDALYAEERLRRGLGGAHYALTRWWQACLDSGWAGATEYYSPPFGRGSLLQGWSGLPADVAVRYRDFMRSGTKEQ